MESTYNGWRNYETWLTNLWLSNDQGTYEYWRDKARDAWQEAETTGTGSRAEEARCILAQWLKDETDDHNPCSQASLYTDLLNAALSEVNWYEVAEAFLEDIADEDEDGQDEE